MTPRRPHGPDRTNLARVPAPGDVQLDLFKDVPATTRPIRTHAPARLLRQGRAVVDVPVGRYL